MQLVLPRQEPALPLNHFPLDHFPDRVPAQETVYVVDQDPAWRAELSAQLTTLGRAVATFRTAQDFLRARRPASAGCLILDTLLPDMCGLDLQRLLAAEGCPPIIFVSSRPDISSAVRAMKAGAVEFLTKPVLPNVLEEAVAFAFAQDRERRQTSLWLQTIRQRFALLTAREREVLSLITAGLLNKQAAATLGIKEVTLQLHRSQIMRKMQAQSFAELVRMAERLGLSASL